MDEEYSGDQDSASGIFGMLEVIVSDFERTIKETAELNTEQKSEFVEFSTQCEASIANKNEASAQFKDELQRAKKTLQDAFQSLVDNQGLLNGKINEWEDLRKPCVSTGVSYEERTEKREDEIRALKDALRILSE